MPNFKAFARIAPLHIGGLATLVLGGPGPVAVDNWLRKRIWAGSSSTNS
ncbi:MAG: hypothetical protein ACM3IG_05325 [Myxococcales bacterium]